MNDDIEILIEILIVDYPHSDKLFSEIWFKDTLIAVINQENEDLEIEPHQLKECTRLTINDFCLALERVKEKPID
jgi:hypothetical protein